MESGILIRVKLILGRRVLWLLVRFFKRIFMVSNGNWIYIFEFRLRLMGLRRREANLIEKLKVIGQI